MGIEATYAVIQYMKAQLAAKSLPLGNVYPGSYAPEDETSNNFALYTVNQNVSYDLVVLHNDAMYLNIYNSSFDTLQRIVSTILGMFNVEDVERDTTLSDSSIDGNETSITRFEDIYASNQANAEVSFVDGADSYHSSLTIIYTYKVERYPVVVAAYIEGV